MTAEITNLVGIVLLNVAAQQSGAMRTNGGKYIQLPKESFMLNTNFVRRVDRYHGPNGKGYIVTVEWHTPSNILSRTVNVGPEKWMGTGWMLTAKQGVTNKVK